MGGAAQNRFGGGLQLPESPPPLDPPMAISNLENVSEAGIEAMAQAGSSGGHSVANHRIHTQAPPTSRSENNRERLALTLYYNNYL